jgi:hypothetical protein
MRTLAEPHYRALAVLLLDLGHSDVECLVAVECCGHLLLPLSGFLVITVVGATLDPTADTFAG